jgi:hypothetical protein
MWCSNCHQDVPGVANAASGRIVCTRCQRPLTGSRASAAASICDEGIALDETEIVRRPPAPPLLDDWSARQHARRLDRKLRPASSAAGSSPFDRTHAKLRFDPPQNLFDHVQHAPPPAIATENLPGAARRNRSHRNKGSQLVSWFFVLTGVAITGAGLGLIYRSFAYSQPQFWNLGLSLSIGGQATLVFGLAMVVMHLWANSRHAIGKLQDVHTRLAELQHTADALTAMRSGGAPTFYADLARGASPQMLLTNLKGQLDQLASRLGTR